MEKTIFEKIAQREVPARIVAESVLAIAFLDAHPVVDGHTLVVPKKAYETISEIPATELTAVMLLVKEVSQLLKKNLGATGVNILHASGKSAQQSVPHFHLHILPRFDNDGHDFWPQGSFAKKTLDDVHLLLSRK